MEHAGIRGKRGAYGADPAGLTGAAGLDNERSHQKGAIMENNHWRDHGHLESVLYIVKGRARMRWGDHLEFAAAAGSPETVRWIDPTHRAAITADAPMRRKERAI
jgi:uncharacterized RmlC-like cupin family protein